MREWIDRYVYAVVHRLPQNQRSDIEKELRGLIEDMLDERAGTGEKEDDRIAAVLKELGHPDELAAKYRGHDRFLIGPGMFDTYVTVLKVVGASIVLGMTVAFVIGLAVDPSAPARQLLDYAANLLAGLISGFAWVTIIFALMERFGSAGKAGQKAGRRDWSPADLPPVPDAKLSIRTVEPVVCLFCLVLGLLLFLSAAGLLTVSRGNAPAVILLFDPETAANRLLLILAAFALAKLREIGKLAERRWTRRLLAGHAVAGLLMLVAGLLLFADASIWNDGFVGEWVDAGVVDAAGEGYELLNGIWRFVQRIVPVAIVAVFAIDLAVTLWKFRLAGVSGKSV